MDSDVHLRAQNKLCQPINQEKIINMKPNKNLFQRFTRATRNSDIRRRAARECLFMPP